MSLYDDNARHMYDVRFRLAASFGGNERTVRVRADDEATAIARAFLVLDDYGIDRCALISCTEATS